MKTLSEAQNRLGFHIHAFAAVATMLLLVGINLWTGKPYWVLWVLLGWGTGLLSHWWFVMGPGAHRTTT
jgi:2TM domain